MITSADVVVALASAFVLGLIIVLILPYANK